AIETVESHIIGGAIIPLWQRFKTQEDTRLRVVRVTTEDGQRIVGVQIPRDRVGAVLRSLGDSRDLREPAELFYAVLDQDEDVNDGESQTTEIALQAEVRATQIIDLDQWFVAVEKSNPEDQTAKTTEPEAVTEEAQPFTLTQEAAVSWTPFTQSEQTQLAFS